ncbi:dephospho-CoA kinase [Mycobacterium sp. 21AC1]|uniref:dephospho-CoA kinase n=1 Tax=[Mycobacterium] appelbergii TaxID=2939269 RepID=UPI0029393C6F|nr:dephospho-CoA kinase [Mycobacterium sp. 21AC1]MDV3129657.1 dephospho-CoA kinase [Mycobacterium sp. 21AC1]
MLRIGLTGGIGAGKSTVSATFAECGGIIVDGDVIAREVVEPGTDGLAGLVEAFGPEILLPDGALNRPALAAVAFSDEEKRATLNGIVHPLVGQRRAELIEAAAPDAVIVEDIPLLVESQMAPLFPLVVIVHAAENLRVARLIEHRGFTESDARARISAQATDEQRRAVADVWLDNSGSQADLVERAQQLWFNRILPFARNLQSGEAVAAPLQPVAYDAGWADEAHRIVARLQTACGHRVVRVDHVGLTAVPGTDAPDVIDVQVTVESLDVADELADALQSVGYLPLADGIDAVEPDARSTVGQFDHSDDAALWRSRLHASADPGRPTNVHLRVAGWPNQQYALLFTDWLRANPGADTAGAYRLAWEWADATGWRP